MFKKKKNKPFSLARCLRKAQKYDQQYLEANIEAVYYHDDPESARLTIEEFLSKKGKWNFSATNPHSKFLWTQALLNTYLQRNTVDRRNGTDKNSYLYNNPLKCALVTFFHREWCCSDKDIQFNLERAKQRVRNALHGISHISRFEAAYYTTESWGKGDKAGKLICFHCHAVIWARTTYGIRKVKKAYDRRFESVLGAKTSGIHINMLKTQDDVSSTLVYISKMPLKGYRITGKAGRPLQEEAKLSLDQRYRLFCAMQDYDLFDYWFAGGEGSVILKDARDKLIQERAKYRSSWRGRSEQRRYDRVPIKRLRVRAF